MKLNLEMAVPEPVPTEDDPFARGYRLVNGPGELWRRPLTDRDLLFPREGDFIVNNPAHNEDREYLFAVCKAQLASRPELRVFGDNPIDFEADGIPRPMGPDVLMVNGAPTDWEPGRGVFPVKQMGARPLVAVEITSPTTRRNDLVKKRRLYFKAGVPMYVLVDLPYGGGKEPAGIVAFQAGPEEYEVLAPAADGRVWLEVVEIFVGAEHGRLICYTPDGKRICNYQELAQQKQAVEQRLQELEAELRRLRGGNP